MACRRRDRANLIGCHVGEVRLRGCSKECCPYSTNTYADIIQHERYDYTQEDMAPSSQNSRGRAHCINPYRQKFVCVDCRRTFKQAFVEGNEYRFDRYNNVETRPSRERIAHVWKEAIRLEQGRKGLGGEWARLQHLINLHATRGEGGMNDKELDELKSKWPDVWWRTLDALCRPQCGKKGVAVGSTFEAPRKEDAREWGRVGEKLGTGSRFSYCMDEGQELEAIAEGARLRRRAKSEEAWQAEKRRRISQLTKSNEMNGGR